MENFSSLLNTQQSLGVASVADVSADTFPAQSKFEFVNISPFAYGLSTIVVKDCALILNEHEFTLP